MLVLTVKQFLKFHNSSLVYTVPGSKLYRQRYTTLESVKWVIQQLLNTQNSLILLYMAGAHVFMIHFVFKMFTTLDVITI